MIEVVDAIRNSFLELWTSTLASFGPFSIHVLQAIGILVLVRIVAGRVRLTVDRALIRAAIESHTRYVVDSLLNGLGWVVTVLWILSIFGLDLTALAAAIGFITVAVSFAVQDVLKNFVAGFILLIERPFKLGQRIKVKDFEGVVEHVKIRTTVLKADDGSTILVPNAVLFAEAITNRSTMTVASENPPAAGPAQGASV